MSMKRGESLGEWILEDVLGEGGNAIVWSGRNREGVAVALKILAKSTTKSVARFRSEIEAHSLLDDIPGVLRLIGKAHVPDVPSKQDPAWFAMPVAERIRDALGPRPALESVLCRAVELANTLSSFATRAAGHRDIKPDNLFVYQGRAVVGDLGLATYEGKPEITEKNEHVGPRGFMPPEIWTGKEVDPLPADVYTLAKTVWVLATDQKWPPQGQIRLDVSGHPTAGFIVGPRVAQLDLLLERATSDDPLRRPTMIEFGSELTALLSPVAGPAQPSGIEAFRARIQAHQEYDVRLEEQQADIKRRGQASFEKFAQEFGFLTQEVREAAGNTAGGDWTQYFPPEECRQILWTVSHGHSSSAGNRGLLFFGVRFTVSADSMVTVCSGARVFRLLGDGSREMIFDSFDVRSATLGSAREEHVLRECINDVVLRSPEYLDVYARILES